MYAAIRQAKAKTGMAEELSRRIKEGAIPVISDVPGFKAVEGGALLTPRVDRDILLLLARTDAWARHRRVFSVNKSLPGDMHQPLLDTVVNHFHQMAGAVAAAMGSPGPMTVFSGRATSE